MNKAKIVKAANEVYEKQREENPPPEFTTDTTGLMDYTNKCVGE